MSSLPLISHHLFVAAAKQKDLASSRLERAKKLNVPPQPEAREVSWELVECDRTVPVQAVCPGNTLNWGRLI